MVAGSGMDNRACLASSFSYSSAIMSLHSSMHSSQIYTPGPAMSFFTSPWLLPQKEHKRSAVLSTPRLLICFNLPKPLGPLTGPGLVENLGAACCSPSLYRHRRLPIPVLFTLYFRCRGKG